MFDTFYKLCEVVSAIGSAILLAILTVLALPIVYLFDANLIDVIGLFLSIIIYVGLLVILGGLMCLAALIVFAIFVNFRKTAWGFVVCFSIACAIWKPNTPQTIVNKSERFASGTMEFVTWGAEGIYGQGKKIYEGRER